jgi:hypothetical protein
MAGLQRFRQCRGYWLGLGVLLAASIASRGAAQQGQGALAPSAEREVVEPSQGGTDPLIYEQRPSAPAAARYDEPPPPPFDYWQPTWMPCQSLRTNRSLVLGHLYFGMDILGWSTKGVHAPPLVTAGSLASEGIIGQGNTHVLFGDQFIQNEMRPGGRLTIGWWFDPNQYSGVEFQYFELDGQNIRFNAAASGGNSILGRPIIDATSGLNAAVPTASDTLSGSIQVGSDLQLTSTSILFRDLFWANQFSRVDYLIGYRHTHLYDRLRTDEKLTSLDDASGFTAGDAIKRVDQFRAVNQFDGLDLGLKGWWSRTGTLAITGLAKVALGASNNNVIINGFTTDGTGRNATTTQGGVLALPSNIGRRAQQEFGVVSEVGLGLEWKPICYWKFSLGYTWFYWSDVARALNQVDRTIDPSQLAPTNSTVNCGCPAFHLHNTSFWAQGINGGFTYQF